MSIAMPCPLPPDALRDAVAERYGQVALHPEHTAGFPAGRAYAEAVGYAADILDGLPPTASASFTGVTVLPHWLELTPGATVLDLGCGAGLDTLIAARLVGPEGRVIGVDNATEMAHLARANAQAAHAHNVTILQAPVEATGLPDAIADAAIANGIVNLSPEKERVVRELHRLLKPGATVTAAEIVLTADIPLEERASLDDWFRWIGGALPEAAFIELMECGGFRVTVLDRMRNQRTNHPATQVLVFRATKR